MMRGVQVRAMSVFSSQGARLAQEDSVFTSREKGIFVVADGFGGPIAGRDASRIACESVRDFLDREAGDLEATLPFVLRTYFSLAGNVIFNALMYANQQILRRNHGVNVHEKGGASVLAGFLDGDLLALASAGACDAWLVREGRSAELVVPRTFGRLLDPFQPQKALEHQVPLMALGLSEDLEPEIFECRVRPGDWLILHTDGLTARVREALAKIQARGLAPNAAAEEIDSALRGGEYPENVAATVIVF
jgi:serine/threonine protein phosphatase PrpC